MKTRLLAFSFVLLFSFCLSGCNKNELEGKGVLTKVNPYFPGAELYKFDKRVLWIQTGVSGISATTAGLLFQNACQQAKYNLGPLKFDITQLMHLDSRSILIVGFRQYLVAWIVSNGVDQKGIPRAEVMTGQQIPTWLMQHLGYSPTPDRILVESLQDIQNTPEGQPMQLRTLAQIQAEFRAKQQEELKGLTLKQSVEQEQNNY